MIRRISKPERSGWICSIRRRQRLRAPGVFAVLIDANLAAVSADVFGRQGEPPPRGESFSRVLRTSVDTVGIAGDQLSRIRQSVLGLQRIVGYVAEMTASQFLLDAVLGFISIEQNDIFKVLTIASVVGITPTQIASMYGMNFHDMPELSWRWGLIHPRHDAPTGECAVERRAVLINAIDRAGGKRLRHDLRL